MPLDKYSSDVASPPKRVSVAVVGCGYWGPNLVRNFARVNNGTLTAVCDLDESRLERLQSSCPSARAVRSYESLLSDPSIDAVVLATPARAHHPMALAALEAGKHVFVEKPLCLNSNDAAELVATAQKRKRTLMVGHLLEYHPAIEYLWDLLRQGDLGEVRYMYSQRVNLGQVRSDENALWSLAPHDISVANLLLGDEPESATATGQAYLRPDVHDVVFLTLNYPGGRIANFHVSWLDPHKIRQMTVVGSRRMAVFDDMAASEKLRLYDKGVDWQNAASSVDSNIDLPLKIRFGDVHIPWIPPTEPLLQECQHFIECIRTGATPRSDGLDGLRVVRVLEAADLSLHQGGSPVTINKHN